MRVLILEDDPQRRELFVEANASAHQVETAAGAIELLSHDEPWSLVCLDHDLGGEVFVDSSNRNTGMEVVRFLESKQGEMRRKIESIIVHSWNSPAASEMEKRLRRAGYRAQWHPFGLSVLAVVRDRA